MKSSAKRFQPWEVDQLWLLPPSVHELVPEGHLAHFVRDTVREHLDLSAIYAGYSESETRGRPPFHPGMMVSLLLYGYCRGVYSSRKIAAAAETRVDFMAVTALQKPDFRTIALFRKDHLQALSELFGQILKLCQKAGLVKLGHVALDGSKFRANASKHKAMSYARMQKVEPELAAEVKKWFERAESEDESEDEQYGVDRRGDELPSWVKSKKARLEKIRAAMAELEAEAKEEAAQQKKKEKEKEKEKKAEKPRTPKQGAKSKKPSGVPKDKAQKNFTDPESRIMKTGDGFQQCYNAQIAVDDGHQLIVSQHITNSGNDSKQLIPLVKGIKENLGKQAREISADAGYCSEENLKDLNRRRINGYVATGRQKHGEKTATGKKIPVAGTLVRKMWVKLKRGGHDSRYRLRKQTVEPVFGQIKSARGFRQFLLRGRDNVASEFSLICTAHNMNKLFLAMGEA
jgi:transposase